MSEFIVTQDNDKDAHDLWVAVCKKDGIDAADKALIRYRDLFGAKKPIEPIDDRCIKLNGLYR